MTQFDLPDVDRFTAGTVGPPGRRVFYLQAVAGGELVTRALEKGFLINVTADTVVTVPTFSVPVWTTGSGSEDETFVCVLSAPNSSLTYG